MSIARHFEDELSALAIAAGEGATLTRSGARTCVASGNLEITIEIDGDQARVSLAGWQRSFALGEDEDGADAAALALDLVGAALFGALRVAVDRYAGVARRFTLQVRGDAGWRDVDVQGSRPWNPLARRTTALHSGAATRPAGYEANPAAALPWAPWAGQAGFFGRDAPAGAADLPVDGELDLHNFHPRDVKRLVLAYIDACLARGITGVRIVHGKGIGNLRRTVHALLDRHPRVKSYRLGGHGGGSWGATIVELSSETCPEGPSHGDGS